MLKRNKSVDEIENNDLKLISKPLGNNQTAKIKLNLDLTKPRTSVAQLNNKTNIEFPENTMKPIFKEYVAYSGKSISFNKKL